MVNNKLYIGMTKGTASNRFKDHVRKLRKECHCNTKLQNAWNKYGEVSFRLDVIADGDFTKSEMCNLEKIFIKLYNTINNGYNIAAGGEGWSDPTGQTAKKVSKSVKEYLATEAGKEQVANATKARVAKLRKDEHWDKLPQVREYWRDKRNGRGGNAHPGQRIISEKFNIPRSICSKMLEHLYKEDKEDIEVVQVSKKEVYKYWSDINNVPINNRGRWQHPGYRNIAAKFKISDYQAKKFIKQFTLNERFI